METLNGMGGSIRGPKEAHPESVAVRKVAVSKTPITCRLKPEAVSGTCKSVLYHTQRTSTSSKLQRSDLSNDTRSHVDRVVTIHSFVRSNRSFPLSAIQVEGHVRTPPNLRLRAFTASIISQPSPKSTWRASPHHDFRRHTPPPTHLIASTLA